MFELKTALSYITPKRERISISLIGILSVLMIAAVIWLSQVFFSASDGFTKRWSESVSSILGTVRITPTARYYTSDFYRIDNYASESGYQALYLDKKASQSTSPYNADIDPPLPTGITILPENPVYQLKNLLMSYEHSSFQATTCFLELQVVPANGMPVALSQLSFLLSQNPTPSQIKNCIVSGTYPSELHSVLLPISFQRLGAKINDQGSLEYTSITPTGPKKHHFTITVSGFYDPGVLPIGGKLIITTPQAISKIQPEPQSDSIFPSTGYSVWPQEKQTAQELKIAIESGMQKLKIDQFFTVETYNRLDFTIELFKQLESEKNLFRLLSIIIMTVACSNIVSLLLILVQSKKQEIAIFRAMGASKTSIMTIFLISGLLIGLLGVILGTFCAHITMCNLNTILAFLGEVQGHEVLSEVFYGTSVPNGLSPSAVTFTVTSTLIIATLSGLLASCSAVRVNVSQALRGEG